jgi:hypothetical protein
MKLTEALRGQPEPASAQSIAQALASAGYTNVEIIDWVDRVGVGGDCPVTGQALAFWALPTGEIEITVDGFKRTLEAGTYSTIEEAIEAAPSIDEAWFSEYDEDDPDFDDEPDYEEE